MSRLTPSFFACLALLGVTLPSTAKVDYNEDVRPILSENCFYCHGPDGNKRKAKLRLDVRADALAKKASYQDKVYRNMIKEMNAFIKQQRHLSRQ